MTHLPVTINSDNWLTQLQANGYRITTPRKAVVEIIAHSPRVLSPADVYKQARKHCHGLGLVTVYRTLEKLEELGLIQRVHQPGGCHSFIASARGHQHLLICQQCGLAEYFSGDNLDPLMKTIGRDSGFSIKEHWLQLFGLCTDCKSND
jgi:Fe2+ or Zn2+ uptake regulation protein